MKMLFYLSINLSLMFTLASNPIIMILNIICQTLMLCIILMLMIQTSWFSFILFLVFMGGLMVLFMYVTSLASNEILFKELISVKLTMLILFTSMMIILMNWEMNNLKLLSINNKLMIFNLYKIGTSWITLMTMFYLLFVLIVAVTIMKTYEAPLRSMISEKLLLK